MGSAREPWAGAAGMKVLVPGHRKHRGQGLGSCQLTALAHELMLHVLSLV